MKQMNKEIREILRPQQSLQAAKLIIIEQFQRLVDRIRLSFQLKDHHIYIKLIAEQVAHLIRLQFDELQVLVMSSQQQDEKQYRSEALFNRINLSQQNDNDLADQVMLRLSQEINEIQATTSYTQKSSKDNMNFIDDFPRSYQILDKLILKEQKADHNFKKSKKVSQIENQMSEKQLLELPIKKNAVNQQEPSQLFKLIVQLKSFACKLTLFNSQKWRMWFLQMEQQQIFGHLNDLNNQQEEHMINQLQYIKQQLIQRTFKYEETCKKHMKKVLYVCRNEFLPQKAYLCHQCMFEESQHHFHQIVCKKHRSPIIFEQSQSIQQKQESDDSAQYFQCRLCSKENNNKTVQLISPCHYAPISSICLQNQCIRQDTFKICWLCPNYHKGHRTIPFNKKSLFNEFNIAHSYDIADYEQLYLSIREKIKLQPIKKLVDSNAGKMWHFAKFIEAFAVHSKKQLEKWVDIILEAGDKEDMLVLQTVGILKQRGYEGNYRINFLEVINDRLQEELQHLFSNIQLSLKQFNKRVEKLMNLQVADIDDNLNSKYKEVKIEKQGSQPMDLQNIAKQHFSRIIKLVIDKEDEYQQQIKAAQKRQANLRKFYHHNLEQICMKQKISMMDRRKIIIALNRKQRNQYQNMQRMQIHEQEIRRFQYFLKQIQQSFELYANSLHVMNFLLSHKLTKLQSVDINYRKLQDKPQQWFSSQVRYDYSVSAFALFQFIHFTPSLKRISIQGVEIMQMDRFMSMLYSIKYQQYQSLYTNNSDWMMEFAPRDLNITINCTFSFDLKDQSDFQDKLTHLTFFTSLFKSFDQIEAKIIIGSTHQLNRHLPFLRDLLMPFKCLKLSIIGCPMSLSSQTWKDIFAILAEFTSITSLEFQYLFLDPYADQYQTSVMQSMLSKISTQNTITHLIIHRCKSFPLLPRFNKLQYLYLKDVSFRRQGHTLRNLVMMNPCLKVFGNEWIEALQLDDIDLSRLTQLQTLHILYSGWLNYKSLRTLPGYSLKHLAIGNHYENIIIGQEWFESLFQRLHSIVTLQLYLINFTGNMLQRIPSPNLSQLHIWQNTLITNDDIWAVDCKWPYLTHLKILSCARVDGRIFGKCKFRGLIELVIDQRLLEESDSCLEYLCKRGIKVSIN